MIRLPILFEEKLSQSPTLLGEVKNTLNLFEPWLEQSGMPFFPGFTDHSPRHISDVLATAASLISDASRELIGAEDVAVLCIAILLHDSGMHMTPDTFRALVAESSEPIVSGLGDLPWAQIWKDFLAEAGRFGQDKLIAVFGDATPVDVTALNLDDLSERDCLLIGEFVRRHHTRIAHEIAIRGIATKSSVALELAIVDPEFRDIAGLVARSHGMSIRDTFLYISEHYGILPIYRNVKIPYLMAILRIADYVQVKSERAIKTLLSVKELRSPISRQEWLNHFSVKDVSTETADPEAYFVQATPKDVKTYLKLAALFKDIQRELDETWGTLGEVYGRSNSLSKLGLTMRRIRSNLDSAEKFGKTVPYIPVKANFDSSGPDLLKLLVGPLYDYEYSVGIRELVQNAVDACREANDLLGEEEDVNLRTVKVSIQEAKDGTGWITVSDNGVGMTLETIRKYYLVAGASFRNSDIWKRQHIDETGQPRITRGGRFGVGALAAFLLGDEITVTTRHIARTEFDGIQFTARIDDPVVELRKCNSPNGTTIKIWVSNPEVFDKLRPLVLRSDIRGDQPTELYSWEAVDWFLYPSPKVEYTWTGYDYGVKNAQVERRQFNGRYLSGAREYVPLYAGGDDGWFALSDPSPYGQILWKFVWYEASDGTLYRSDEVTVNGIRVEKIHDRRNAQLPPVDMDRASVPHYTIRRPSMAISDPSGLCPINLQRNAIAYERMGIDDRLCKEILQSHFEALKSAINSFESLADFMQICTQLDAAEGISYDGQFFPLALTSRGVMLLTPRNIVNSKIETLYFLDVGSIRNTVDAALRPILSDDEAVLLRRNNLGLHAWTTFFRNFFALHPSHDSHYGNQTGLPYLAQNSRLIVMPNEDWEYFNQKNRMRREILDSVSAERVGADRSIVFDGLFQAQRLRRRVVEILRELPAEVKLGAWELSAKQPHGEKTSLLSSTWDNVFGSYIYGRH
jgi:hypothetical protein